MVRRVSWSVNIFVDVGATVITSGESFHTANSRIRFVNQFHISGTPAVSYHELLKEFYLDSWKFEFVMSPLESYSEFPRVK